MSKNKTRYFFSYIPDGQGNFKIIKRIVGRRDDFIEMSYAHYKNEEDIIREVQSMNRFFYSLSEDDVKELSKYL
jgi:cytochrome c553